MRKDSKHIRTGNKALCSPKFKPVSPAVPRIFTVQINRWHCTELLQQILVSHHINIKQLYIFYWHTANTSNIVHYLWYI